MCELHMLFSIRVKTFMALYNHEYIKTFLSLKLFTYTVYTLDNIIICLPLKLLLLLHHGWL